MCVCMHMHVYVWVWVCLCVCICECACVFTSQFVQDHCAGPRQSHLKGQEPEHLVLPSVPLQNTPEFSRGPATFTKPVLVKASQASLYSTYFMKKVDCLNDRWGIGSTCNDYGSHDIVKTYTHFAGIWNHTSSPASRFFAPLPSTAPMLEHS